MKENSLIVPGTIKEKVYDDLAHPGMNWAGKIIGAVGHACYASMGLPLEKWAERKERQVEELNRQIESGISRIPENRRIEPSYGTVQAIFEGLESCLDEELLQVGFVSLLCSAMDSNVATPLLKCHANILKQLCPDEAKILKALYVKRVQAFIDVRSCLKGTTEGVTVYQYVTDINDLSKCESPDDIPSYLVHLETLGLLQIDSLKSLVDKRRYDLLEEKVKDVRRIIKDYGRSYDISRGMIYLTPLGKDFAKSCGLEGN